MAIGAWLMCTRLAFGTDGAQAAADHLLRALVVTVSIAALAEVARPLRFVNVVLGVALIGAPWMLDGGTPLADWAGALAGAALIALAVPRGAVRSRYGVWNRWIVWPAAPASRAARARRRATRRSRSGRRG